MFEALAGAGQELLGTGVGGVRGGGGVLATQTPGSVSIPVLHENVSPILFSFLGAA